MGWDIVVCPSSSSGNTHQKIHNYVIVGIVKVNEDKDVWKEKTGKPPPVGNHKIIVSNLSEYSQDDIDIINKFFSTMWQFEEPEWFDLE